MAHTHVRYEAKGWGVGELWLEGDRLLHHEHPRPGIPGGSDAHALAVRIVRYFGGKRDDFLDVELDLDGATAFEEALTAALRGVPSGETVTYGELAALAGRPNAQRAAGSFCARNRFAIVVPCHRVVAAEGLGSYGSLGIEYKRRLLELEGVAV
jgi:methylated-DNA-[protein]-cysteine S-methyltransferase